MLIFLISKYIENEVKKDNSTSISRVLLFKQSKQAADLTRAFTSGAVIRAVVILI